MVGTGFEFLTNYSVTAVRQFSILTHRLTKKQVKINIRKQFLIVAIKTIENLAGFPQSSPAEKERL